MAIRENQRHTEQVKLRLPPEVAAEMRACGRAHPRGASGVVADLLAAAGAERVDDVSSAGSPSSARHAARPPFQEAPAHDVRP